MRQPASRTIRSTEDVAAPDAFAYWSDVICDTLVHVAVRPTGEQPFQGWIEHTVLDGIGWSTLSSGPQQVTRTGRMIARDQDEFLLVNIQTAGQAVVRQDGRAAALAPGSMTFLDSTRPYALERVHRFVQRHAHDLRLDAPAVAAGCGMSRRSLFRVLAADGEPLTALIRRLRVARARQLLRARPGLPLAAVALECGFAGTAQLHRAFRSVTGTTPGAYRAGESAL
ncbi:AraC family transcriptional regulator [Nonomuraea terrae]|uniref:AraC family transcriptional regulator n=1 Tax=Nonomuraea terrae TaxID=2530383 RepID=A0A4R4YZZ7_9ACTN|nr:AraC family transcriptional regulator [Nonomuraea terrae]TDD50234.1 AraC family transcriptional regulator [Nonomuraea terrae]